MSEDDKKQGIRFPNYGQDAKRKFGDDEEYAAEIVPDSMDEEQRRESDVVSTYGWIGIVLSFLSFLIWPLLLSVSGIILGFVSRSKGADTLGNIAIGMGVAALLIRFIF